MKNASLRRRLSAVTALSSVLALTLAACGDDADAGSAEPAVIDRDADLSGQSIVVSNWADYMPADIVDIVKEQTGATVTWKS